MIMIAFSLTMPMPMPMPMPINGMTVNSTRNSFLGGALIWLAFGPCGISWRSLQGNRRENRA
jgi:hypothetical protein